MLCSPVLLWGLGPRPRFPLCKSCKQALRNPAGVRPVGCTLRAFGLWLALSGSRFGKFWFQMCELEAPPKKFVLIHKTCGWLMHVPSLGGGRFNRCPGISC